MPQPLTTTETTHFDTVIVGFGKASKTLAGMLARAGRSVALVERSAAMFGGTCINIGCVPTKTLLHVADQLLRDRGEGGRSLANRGPVPSTTFLTPPLSRVGLSAAEAQAQAAANGWDVVVARKNVADIAAMPRPKAVADPRGFLQVVVDRATERILGATLFCVESQEVINLVTMAMRHDLPYPALRDAIFTHPSSTEGLNELLGAI